MTSFVNAGCRSLLAASPSRLFEVDRPSGIVVATPLTSPASCSRRHAMTSRLQLRCELSVQGIPNIDVKPSRREDKIKVIQGLREGIHELITTPKLSASPLDIAWVAMIPSPTTNLEPYFPECLEWILKNQAPNGSWTINVNHHYLVKNTILSTLACILALEQWKVGSDLIQKGIEFIQINSTCLADKSQMTPIGFSVIFSRMIQYGKQLGLSIPISEDIQSTLSNMSINEVQSNTSTALLEAYLAYLAEGICPIQDNGQLKEYQKKNGSVYNSPSATAAMLMRMHDAKAMEYLRCVVHKSGGGVYPSDMYTHLCMVDSFEKLGIAYHFKHYIESVLDETYSAWLRNEEELYSDISTCALAFRILRMHGYEVSAEIFAHMNEEELLNYKSNNCPQNIAIILELYKSSLMQLCEDEICLQKLYCWSRQFLEQILSEPAMENNLEISFLQEVDYNLKFPFSKNLQRLENKWNIENYNASRIQDLTSSFRVPNLNEEDILKLAMDDFNYCQSVYQEEFKLFQRWARETKLVNLFREDESRIVYCYFSAAATIIPPELTDARMAWAKNSLLVTIVDDFFDDFGCTEEHENLVDLCTRWNPDYRHHCCSTQVYILFAAIYSTIYEFGTKASLVHGHCVTSHFINSWVDVVKSMHKEAQWQTNRIVPTMDEYMTNGYVSFGLGPIIMSAAYFVGPKLSRDIVASQEYQILFELLSTCGRLINDFQGLEREAKAHKLNSVSLKAQIEKVSEEDANKELWNICNATRTKLLELVLRRNGSMVPRACKDLFWNMCRICYYFYSTSDGFRRSDFLSAVKAVIYEPICGPKVSSPKENSL